MGVLDFIFGIIALLVGAFVVIGTVCTIYDNKKLKEENIKLKDKKISKVGGKNEK